MEVFGGGAILLRVPKKRTLDDLIQRALKPGETLAEFAARAKLSARSLQEIRRHGAEPRMGTIAALALALGTSAEVVKAAIAASGKRSKGG